MQAVDRLQRILQTRQSELVGCQRQNRFRGPDTSWRYLRGNALCAQLGYKITVNTPIDELDVFYEPEEKVIIFYRGGKWKPWWAHDIELTLALCKLYLNEGVTGAYVLHELDNELTQTYVSSPDSDEASELVQVALEGWRNHSRIHKDSPRAQALCQYCPVKRQCDAVDLEQGATHDWPAGYRVG